MASPTTLRGLSPEAREQLKRGAQARGLTMAAYIEALLELHAGLLNDKLGCGFVLNSYGLGPVSV